MLNLISRTLLLLCALALFSACSDDSTPSTNPHAGSRDVSRPGTGSRPDVREDLDAPDGDFDTADPADSEQPGDTGGSADGGEQLDVAAPDDDTGDDADDISNPWVACSGALTPEELAHPAAASCEFFAHTTNTLYAIDPIRKTIREIGRMGGGTFFDMDTMPDGRLYAIRTGSPYSLVEVDVSTGSQQLVMELSAVSGNANGLCINSNGDIYITAGQQLYRVDDINDQVYTMPSSIGYTSSGDCVFDRKLNDLYMSASGMLGIGGDGLVHISAAQGDGNLIGRSNHSGIYGLTVAWDVLYGVTGSGQLVEISMVDGSSTLIHNFGSSYVFNGAASTAGPDL